MAPQAKKRLRITSSRNGGILSRVTTTILNSIIASYVKAAADATFIYKKLLMSAGRATWIAGTTFLVLTVPLIIKMDREQQATDIELQQQSLLGPPPSLVSGQK